MVSLNEKTYLFQTQSIQEGTTPTYLPAYIGDWVALLFKHESFIEGSALQMQKILERAISELPHGIGTIDWEWDHSSGQATN